jgi:hypothetical protein
LAPFPFLFFGPLDTDLKGRSAAERQRRPAS